MNEQLCMNCMGLKWVCENHPNKPWTSKGGCDCGAGEPCKVCNDFGTPEELLGSTVIVKRLEKKKRDSDPAFQHQRPTLLGDTSYIRVAGYTLLEILAALEFCEKNGFDPRRASKICFKNYQHT